MRWMACSLLLIPLLGVGYHLYELLGFGVELDIMDNNRCTLLGGDELYGSEDFAHMGGGVILVSSGDLHKAFHGASPHVGGIFKLDLSVSRPTLTAVPVHGLPAELGFQPHGIHLSNRTQRLFVVSHGLEAGGGTRVIVFGLLNDPAGGSSLHYQSSVLSPCGHGCFNDVVEGEGEGELYVTQWLQFPLPPHGKDYPQGIEERLWDPLQQLAQLTYAGASVWRCTFQSDAVASQCSVATGGFLSPNGITKDSATGRIFVSDAPRKHIAVLTRNADGSLVRVDTIALQYALDNLEFEDESGVLFGGSLPLVYKTVAKMSGQDVQVPGGITVISPRQGGDYDVDENTLMHDGSVLSMISAGYVWSGRAVFGSPFSRGVLVCET